MAIGSEVTIRVPAPLRHQRPILSSPARHKVIACGRRWGKTVLGLIAAILGHGQRQGDLLGAAFGGHILWVAPTYKIIRREVWPLFKESLRDAWTEKNEIDNTIRLPGGGKIVLGSTDNPTSLLGSGWHGIVFDEAAHAMRDGEVWMQTLRPALVDKQGWSIKISTPNGFNWFHEQFTRAAQEPGWERWQQPTTNNALIPPAELEEALLDMGPRVYAQEHLAQFTSVEGAEFDSSYFHDGIWFDEWPSKLVHRIIALDPSKGKNEKSDYSAFAIMAQGMDRKLYVDCDMGRRDVRQIIDDGIGLARHWRPEAYGVEINQFQEVLADELYRRAKESGLILPMYGINNQENKITRIRATLTPLLARDEIRFKTRSPGCKLLVEQLRAFPVDNYDDGPDALEMAVRLWRSLTGGGGAGQDERVWTV